MVVWQLQLRQALSCLYLVEKDLTRKDIGNVILKRFDKTDLNLGFLERRRSSDKAYFLAKKLMANDFASGSHISQDMSSKKSIL